MRKKDYILAAVAGVITAFFILPVLKNIDVYIPYRLALFFIIPLLWLGLIFIASFLRLKEKILWLNQFGKFFIVGFLNTSIDFGILNIMSMRLGIYAGLSVIGVNPFSFLITGKTAGKRNYPVYIGGGCRSGNKHRHYSFHNGLCFSLLFFNRRPAFEFSESGGDCDLSNLEFYRNENDCIQSI